MGAEVGGRKNYSAFNIVLVLKDGNVTIARQFLTCHSPSGEHVGILCKGAQDRSRVSRGDQRRPHETDFEGLATFLRRAGQPPFYLNAIAVDDNCTGGSSLCYAMQSFNELIAAKGYPINPVQHAVVLFNVKSVKTADNFQNLGFASCRGFHLAMMRWPNCWPVTQKMLPLRNLGPVSPVNRRFTCAPSRASGSVSP